MKGLSEDDRKFRFSGYMSFGTAGLRSQMGVGSAMMNTYTDAHIID